MAPNHRVLKHFGGDAPPAVMHKLLKNSKHPIHELELIPVLVALKVWENFLKGCQVVHYIDNESVRLALLRGSGETEVARCVMSQVMNAEFFLGTKSWYARVCSISNLADDPSRGKFDLLTKLGSTFCEIEWEEVLASCSP